MMPAPAVFRLSAALGLMSTLSAVSPAYCQESNSIAGHWQTPDGAAIVAVSHCAQTICAKLVWLRGDASVRDERNPNSAKRAQRVCGLDLFSEFRLQPDGSWSSGSVYDPETGETISPVSLQVNRSHLRLTVGRGLFAGSEKWQRVSKPAQACL
jgi:uncharacterized protein (DUF2147 family)